MKNLKVWGSQPYTRGQHMVEIIGGTVLALVTSGLSLGVCWMKLKKLTEPAPTNMTEKETKED
jgi:hypothetical protein